MRSKPTHADLAGSRYLALQRLARAQKRSTAELLQLYVLESFLRRLVRSRHDHSLVLKGGMLLAAFGLRRATRDVDVLALRTDNDPGAVERLMVDVTSVETDDGVEFLPDTITAAAMRDDDVYPGVRASLEARLATARLKFSVDVNVGDPVVPAPIRTAIPWRTMLGDDGVKCVRIPRHSPNCNPFAERFVRSIRTECLNHFVILGERHLRHLLQEYVVHYNAERFHQGLGGRLITEQDQPGNDNGVSNVIRRRKRLGGILNFYHLNAA